MQYNLWKYWITMMYTCNLHNVYQLYLDKNKEKERILRDWCYGKCFSAGFMVFCASWVVDGVFASYLPFFVIPLLCCCGQSCLIHCEPMNCSPPGSSVHGIFQARILERVAMPSSRGSSWPRDQTRVSCISFISVQAGPLSLVSPKTSIWNEWLCINTNVMFM